MQLAAASIFFVFTPISMNGGRADASAKIFNPMSVKMKNNDQIRKRDLGGYNSSPDFGFRFEGARTVGLSLFIAHRIENSISHQTHSAYHGKDTQTPLS